MKRPAEPHRFDEGSLLPKRAPHVLACDVTHANPGHQLGAGADLGMNAADVGDDVDHAAPRRRCEQVMPGQPSPDRLVPEHSSPNVRDLAPDDAEGSERLAIQPSATTAASRPAPGKPSRP